MKNHESNYEPMTEIARFPIFTDENGNKAIPQTREERLTHLINILESVELIPASNFYMSRWVRYNLKKEEIDTLEKCGFAGCALGWASIDPTFNQAGLKLGGHDHDEPSIYHPEWGVNLLNFDAGQIFFDISDTESSFLFDPDTYYANYYNVLYKLDEPEDIKYHIDDPDLEYVGFFRGIHEDLSMTFPFPFHEVDDKNNYSKITPRMVINRIKHIMKNPFL